MRKGRTEEAAALAWCIGNEITRHSKTQLSLMHENVDSREMWACVRRLTGKRQNVGRVDGITDVVRRTLLTMCNGEIGNFVMVKN